MDTNDVQITEDTTAFIFSAEGVDGSNTVKVTFIEAVYANSNQTGDLQTSDLAITDSDNSRTITGVTHTAGSTIAYLTLSLALDSADDIGVDTVAAVGGAVFRAAGTSLGTTPATITAQAAPTIASAKGQTGYDKLEVTFSEGVWTGTGQAAGALVTTDLGITDIDNSRTITGISHTAGETVATLTLSYALDDTDDIGTDTIAAVSSEIFNNMDNAVSTSDVTITTMPAPALYRAEGYVDGTLLYVLFTEGVSLDPDLPVSIDSLAANFTVSGAARVTGVSFISHTGGSRSATFTMNDTMDAADVDTATLMAPAASIFNKDGYPVGIESIFFRAKDSAQLVEVNGKVGYDLIVARFDQEVYSNTGADENDGLQTGDFTLVDVGTVSTISSVNHTPGIESWMHNQDFAFITLSAPLEADDIGETTLAATTIYNDVSNPVPTTPVYVDDSMILTTMTSATGSVGSDKIEVAFKNIVSSSPGLQDALVPADFVLTDTNSDNTRTITDVDHRPGDITATITMSSPLISADLNNDTIGAVSASIFNAFDYPVDNAPVTIVSRYGGPKVKSVIGTTNQQGVVVYFDQGAYANSDGTGSLEAADFTYYEVRQSTKANTILTVDHNPGDDYAVLHFEFNRCNRSTYCSGTNDYLGDFYADQIGATADQIFGRYGDPADLTPVTMILGVRPWARLSAAEGVVGSSKVLVKVTEGVWTGKDAVGAIVAADLCYESNNSRTISSITHTPGDNYAVLNMSAPTIETDFDVDAFNPLKNTIWTGYDYGVMWGSEDCPNTSDQRQLLARVPAPIITGARARAGSDQVVVTFSEGARGQVAGDNNMAPADFVFDDVSNNGNSIQSVIHAEGDDIAYLTMNQDIVAGDLDTDTIAASANLKDYLIENPLDTTPVTLRAAATAIMAAEGSVGYTRIAVTFSVPVYANNDRTGNLAASDFALVDESGNGAKTITGVSHTAGDSLAVLTLNASLETEDNDHIDPDTLAAIADSIYDALGEAIDTTTVFLTSYNGPFITRVEGTAGQDKVQVNFSEGVYSAPGKIDALDTADFVLTDNDDGRTITDVEHYEGSAAAILTLSSALDRDSDVGMDTIAAASNEIFSSSSEPMSTVPVAMISNECPPGGFLLNFDESAGSTTVTDSTGLVVGELTTGDLAFGILGDGYFTGDPIQQVPTYIDFTQNNRCFKTPRAYTMETRVYFATVDLDYGDAYPLNGLDDDWDYGDPDGPGTVPSHSQLPEYDPLTPDGRRQTRIDLYRRNYLVQSFGAVRANYLGYGTEEKRDTIGFGFRHWIQDQTLACDGSRPNDPRVRSSYVEEEAGGGSSGHTLVSGHWYTLRVVFNTDKTGSPFDFFGRDEGTDGMGTGANWSGYVNLRDKTNDIEGFQDCNFAANPGSEHTDRGGSFIIGGYDWEPGDIMTPWIPGKMDWFSYKPIADYKGLQEGPYNGNTVPVADAGPDQGVTTGSFVTLDGTGSSDGDSDEITYSWTITSKPATSTAALSDNTFHSPSFTADKDGTYTIELTVEDDFRGIAADTITVTASPPP
jgi:hypothetical protein